MQDQNEIRIKDIYDSVKNIEQKLTYAGQTWLDVNELSRYLCCSESTIRRLVSASEIPFKRVGGNGKILFHKRQIDLWLLTGEKSPNKRSRLVFQDIL